MCLIIKCDDKYYLTIYKNNVNFRLTEDKTQALAFNSDYSEKFYNAVTAMCQNYEKVEIERIIG